MHVQRFGRGQSQVAHGVVAHDHVIEIEQHMHDIRPSDRFGPLGVIREQMNPGLVNPSRPARKFGPKPTGKQCIADNNDGEVNPGFRELPGPGAAGERP